MGLLGVIFMGMGLEFSRETPESSLSPSVPGAHSRKGVIWKRTLT